MKYFFISLQESEPSWHALARVFLSSDRDLFFSHRPSFFFSLDPVSVSFLPLLEKPASQLSFSCFFCSPTPLFSTNSRRYQFLSFPSISPYKKSRNLFTGKEGSREHQQCRGTRKERRLKKRQHTRSQQRRIDLPALPPGLSFFPQPLFFFAGVHISQATSRRDTLLLRVKKETTLRKTAEPDTLKPAGHHLFFPACPSQTTRDAGRSVESKASSFISRHLPGDSSTLSSLLRQEQSLLVPLSI